MFSLQSCIELCVALSGGIYIIGQIKSLAEGNRNNIESLKKDLTDLINKNNDTMQDLFEAFKTHQAENLEREVRHLKDLMEISAKETRSDIQRLEARQNESNRIKERIALAESSIRSLHKRLDIEPPMELPE